MKRLLPPFLMFLVGSVVGYQAALPILIWFAVGGTSAAINLETVAPFAIRAEFALGLGALFASAVIAPAFIARSPRSFLWSVAYLWLGLLLSAAGTAQYHAMCASMGATDQNDAALARYCAENSPIPWTLVALAVLLLSLGLVHRSVLGFRAKSAHRAAHAR